MKRRPGMASSPTQLDPSSFDPIDVVRNYDVLLDKNGEKSLILDSSQKHNGNNRFRILANMYRDEFDERLTAGEGIDVIADKIIGIFCHKCEPNGRFMLTQGKGKWIILTENESHEFVMDFLMNSRKPRTPLDTLPSSMKTPSRESYNELDLADPCSHFDRRHSAPASIDAEKKRRRRSSQSSRSSRSFNDDEKKSRSLFKFPTISLPSTPFWFFKMKESKRKLLDLDVMFDHSRTSLTLGPVGNNRLAIMIEVQQDSYLKASDIGKKKILCDVYKTVTESWKGRFLIESTSRNSFIVMEKKSVLILLSALFDSSDSGNASVATFPVSENLSEDEHVSSSEVVKLSTVRRKSITAKHSVVAMEDHVTNVLQTAALASLQKRRIKQNMNSRIRNLSLGTLSRSYAASQVTCLCSVRSSSDLSLTSFDLDDSEDVVNNLTPVLLPVFSLSPSPPTHSFADGYFVNEPELVSSRANVGEIPSDRLSLEAQPTHPP